MIALLTACLFFSFARAKLHQQKRALKLCSATLKLWIAIKVAPYSFWTARELISKISRWRELSISTLKSRAESRSKMPTNMASKFLKFVYR